MISRSKRITRRQEDERQAVQNCLVFALTAYYMIKDGCPVYLAHVIDDIKSIKKINDIFDSLRIPGCISS